MQHSTDITIGVVIPCYNVQAYIAYAVNSALSQTSKFDQIILVDDGSTDNTWNEIQKFRDVAEVDIFKLDKNKGLGYARNFGTKQAHTEFIMFMDSDDLIDANLVSDFRKHISLNRNTNVFIFSMMAVGS